MNETLVAPAIEAPSEAETEFDALYRSSRDDVFAYVCGLMRDRSAAEDVTAQAFERAYRAGPASSPNGDRAARGCSGSRATRRSTSCAGAPATRR